MIYLLSPTQTGWEHISCDCKDGFVIRADSVEQARILAQEKGSDEVWRSGESKSDPFWTDPNLSDCIEVAVSGEACIILYSFLAG